MKKFEIYFGILRLPVDFVLAILALFSAYFFRKSEFATLVLDPADVTLYSGLKDYMTLSLILCVALIFIFSFFRLYSLKSIDSYATQCKKVILAVAVWLMAIVTYYFLIREFPFSRFVIVFSGFLVVVFVSFGRFIVHLLQNYFLKKGIGVRRVVLVGSSLVMIEKILQSLKSDIRYEIVGYISPTKFDVSANYLGDFAQLEAVIKRKDLDDVIHIGNLKDGMTNHDLIDFCRFYHKEYQFVPEVFEVQRHNILLSQIGGFPIFRVKPTSLDGWGRVLKRLFDFFVSLIVFIILSPFLLIIAIFIKLTSHGPVLFKYLDDGTVVKRSGYKGKPFYCYKFRTMISNTHNQRYEQLSTQDFRHGSPLVKIKNDPRVTSFGRFLRRFDLDELPQLFNVLIGNMSLVGPRPHLVEEVEKYHKHHKFVFTVKPGITGLAQVNGRSDLDFEEEVRLDTFYIENWNIFMDIKILIKTVGVVLKGHGEQRSRSASEGS